MLQFKCQTAYGPNYISGYSLTESFRYPENTCYALHNTWTKLADFRKITSKIIIHFKWAPCIEGVHLKCIIIFFFFIKLAPSEVLSNHHFHHLIMTIWNPSLLFRALVRTKLHSLLLWFPQYRLYIHSRKALYLNRMHPFNTTFKSVAALSSSNMCINIISTIKLPI